MATAETTPSPQAPPEATAGAPEGVPYPLSAADYFRMVDADIIPADRRVGLWKGMLYEKMAKKLPHAGASSKVPLAFWRVLPEGWCVWPDNPILLDDFSAPLPDVAIVRGGPDDYTGRGSVPKAGEIGLVVELSDSSLRKDRTRTLEVYAAAGLPYYWVVNLVDRRVEVYSGPKVEGGIASYAAAETFGAGRDVPVVLDGREAARVPVVDLLPREAV